MKCELGKMLLSRDQLVVNSVVRTVTLNKNFCKTRAIRKTTKQKSCSVMRPDKSTVCLHFKNANIFYGNGRIASFGRSQLSSYVKGKPSVFCLSSFVCTSASL